MDEVTFEAEDLLTVEPEPEPEFPFMIFFMAIVKDVLDSLDLTLIGIIITTPISLILLMILFLWTITRLRGGWWKKIIIRRLWIFALIELSPFGKIVPATTIFVWMAHNHEKKWVQALNATLETYARGIGLRGL